MWGAFLMSMSLASYAWDHYGPDNESLRSVLITAAFLTYLLIYCCYPQRHRDGAAANEPADNPNNHVPGQPYPLMYGVPVNYYHLPPAGPLQPQTKPNKWQ